MVDVFVYGLGSNKYNFKNGQKDVFISDVIKFIEKEYHINEPRLIYKIRSKYRSSEDDSKIVEGAKINIKYNPEKAIYAKYNDEWIKDGWSFKNFYKDLKGEYHPINEPINEYQRIFILKEKIKTYLKIEEEIELTYMNAKPVDESLMLCDVFGGVGQDVIVQLKYPKYINIYFGDRSLDELVDIIRKGHYYRGSEKDKFKPYSLDVRSGVKTKLRTYIYRRNYIDPNPEKAKETKRVIKYHDNRVERLLEKYPELNWLNNKYELYKIMEWERDMSTLYFKLIETDL